MHSTRATLVGTAQRGGLARPDPLAAVAAIAIGITETPAGVLISDDYPMSVAGGPAELVAELARLAGNLDADELVVIDDRSDAAGRASPHIRFLAAAPVVAAGRRCGMLTVADRRARSLSSEQRAALLALAASAGQIVALADRLAEKERHIAKLEEYQLSLEANLEDVTSLSITDSLTGLKNRAAFEDALEQELQRERRHGNGFAIAMVDVDHFKAYNDRFGHQAGDRALRRLGELLSRNCRRSDFVARIGGEEFAIILNHCDATGAEVLAERLRGVVDREPWEHLPLTISVGVTAVEPGDSTEDLVGRADGALYDAKERGRNRVVFAA